MQIDISGRLRLFVRSFEEEDLRHGVRRRPGVPVLHYSTILTVDKYSEGLGLSLGIVDLDLDLMCLPRYRVTVRLLSTLTSLPRLPLSFNVGNVPGRPTPPPPSEECGFFVC